MLSVSYGIGELIFKPEQSPAPAADRLAWLRLAFGDEPRCEIDAQEGVLFNYLIGLRNNNDYLYANIFFFVDVESPDGERQIDTLQYLLAEPGGKWLGSGVGEIKFNLFKFKEDLHPIIG